MTRIVGLSLALVLPLSWVTTTNAQITPYGLGGAPSSYYGVSAYGGQVYGGFGLEYSQTLTAGGMIMDQYGLWHVVPYVESVPPVAAARTAAPPWMSRSVSRRVVTKLAQPRYQLPTGSLGLSGTNGGILYSPGMRHQSYGYGWPVGASDYSGMWHGMPSGY
jgi:hypothetical protein